MLAPAAFVAPSSTTIGLVQQLLPFRMQDCSYPAFKDGVDVWSQDIVDSTPTDDAVFRQKAWDILLMVTELELVSKLLLKKNLMPGFGQSLCLPRPRLEDAVVCVATGLRLGLSFCRSNACQHCEA